MSVALSLRFVKRFLFVLEEIPDLCLKQRSLPPFFPAKSKELVVHSGKWATSSYEIGDFPQFPAKSKELVVHSGKWTTSSYEIGAFPRFLAKSEEPVVHSGKWTTSSY